jgi:predicted ATP-dependent serine protease
MADEKKTTLKAADKEAKAKDAALQAAVTHIEREFGQGSLMRLGDKSAIQVETIPTGALSLDLALGVGGVPRGRIVEIFGPESSGKTTLVYHIIAEAQTSCSSPSPTTASRRSRSSTSWSAPERWTWSRSTRWRR